MLGAGLALVNALDILTQHEEPEYAQVFEPVSRRVSEGHYLSQAMAPFGETFSPVYLSLVQIGENTGQLVIALEVLHKWLAVQQDTERRVRSALIYPVVVLGVSVFFALALFIFVLPSFLDFFDGLGGQLPLITQAVMVLTKLAVNPGFWLLFLAVIAEIVHLLRSSWRLPDGRVKIYRWLVRIPGLGGLLKTVAVARYAAGLSLTLSFGVDLLESVKLAAKASGSPLYIHDLKNILYALSQGESLAEYYYSRPDIYPYSFAAMTSAAEQSSRLDFIFAKLSELYEQELDTRIATFSALLEPVLLFGVAAVVGSVVLSIYLPLAQMIQRLAA